MKIRLIIGGYVRSELPPAEVARHRAELKMFGCVEPIVGSVRRVEFSTTLDIDDGMMIDEVKLRGPDSDPDVLGLQVPLLTPIIVPMAARLLRPDEGTTDG